MADAGRREGRFFPLAAAVAERSDIGAAAKLTHAALSSYDAMGRATPGQGRLARELGLSLKTVSRAIRELQAAGLVTVTPGAVGGACLYQLTPVNSTPVNLTTPVTLTHPPPPNRLTLPGQNDSLIDDLIDDSIDASDASSCVDRITWLRDSLATFNESLGRPDEAIARKIDAATRGASLDQVGEVLGKLYDDGLPSRMRTWALLAKVLEDEFREAA